MSFRTEIEKLARTRRAYLRFARKENKTDRSWAGPEDRRYGKVADAQGVQVVGGDRDGLVPIVGTISRFGTIQRSLATFLTSLEIPNVSVELFDPTREWRALGGGLNDQLTYRAVSFWLRVLDDLRAPIDERIAVAHIRKVAYPSGGKVTLDCQVASGSFLGAKVPRRFITTEDFPLAPPETQGLPVPIIYGRRSNTVSPFTIPDPDAPPGAAEGLPGTGPTDDPVTLPPFTGSETIYCSDLWVDDFESGLDGYSAGTAGFTLAPGAGADGSAAVRPVVPGAELTKTLTPPRRAFCVEWSSDHDVVPTGNATVEAGVNIYRMGGRDISIVTPWAGELAYLTAVLTPGTRQTFRLEGAFATKNLTVTLTSGVNATETTLHVSPTDAARLRAGMHLQLGGEIVRILSVSPTVPGAFNVIRAQFRTIANSVPAGTVLQTHDVNGYLKFLINGASVFTRMDTDVVRSASDTGEWTTVVWSPNGDGDNLKIGSGLLYTPPAPYVPPTYTAPVGGSSANPAPTPECQPGHEGGSPSGAAVRALLVGTYNLGSTGDVPAGAPGAPVPPSNPCGRPPYGTTAALADDLTQAKEAGTLMADWPLCIGFAHTQELIDLEGDIPTDDAGLAAIIGWSTLNCLVYGDCGGGSGGSTSTPGAGGASNVYVLSGHACKKVTTVYVLKPVVVQNFSEDGDESPTRSDPVQVQMVEGVDYRQGWMDINGHRYHLLAFNQAQTSETCEYFEVTANVEGIETNGDGSGTLIENADEIVEHVMLNWILNSYQKGPWFTDVPYAKGVWDADSVDRVKAVAARRVPGGYKGMGTLDVVIEAREWLRELLISYDLELFFNNNIGDSGAWSLSRFDPQTALDLIPHWDAGVDPILKDSFSSEIAIDQMVNTLPFFAGPTTQKLDTKGTSAPKVEGGGWVLSGQFESPSSIERYGIAKSDPIYLKWTDDPATVGNVMSRYLSYLEYPPIPASFRMGLKALGGPLGSLVRITHPDGPGSTGIWPGGTADGWIERICKVVRSDIDMDRLVAQVTVNDVDRLMYPATTIGVSGETLVFSINGQGPLSYFTYTGQPLPGPACDPAGSRGATWGGMFQGDNGVMAFAGMNVSGGSDCFALYNPSFARTFGSGTEPTHGLGYLYSGTTFWTHQPVGGVHWLRQITSAGVVTSKGPLPAPPGEPFYQNVAVSPDGAIAYYGFWGPTIKRWNLTSNSAMSDLVTLPGHMLLTMFCLRDGSLVVAWNEPSHQDKIIRYSPSGTVLGTRPAPGGLAYIAAGLTDASIWAAGYTTAFQLTVAEIQVSTGAILRTFQLPLTTANFAGPFMVLKTLLPVPPPP
jgi:hypothetical protein